MNLATLFHPHDPVLVLVTLCLAVLASFVSLELAGRVKAAIGAAKYRWLAAAGLAMGGGIWSMHFVAMIALELPFAVAYQPALTILSLLVSVALTTSALFVVFWNPGSSLRFIPAGLIMGLGVAAMHYVGMAALIMPAVQSYNLALVALSILIAVIASIAALWLAFTLEELRVKLAGALLMGVAVAGMHFTGMAAVSFICGAGPHPLPPAGLSTNGLAISVAGAAAFILLMGLALAMQDRRAKQRAWARAVARASELRVNALLRHAVGLFAIVDQNWRIAYMSATSGPCARAARNLSIGGNLLAVFEPSSHEAAIAFMAEALANPAMPIHTQFRGAANPDQWFELSLNDQTADKVVRGIIVNLHDITDSKQATKQVEIALVQAREAARRAEEHALELEQAHAATRAAEEYAQELENAHAATRAAEQQANKLARHDALTGLPNRRAFSHDLETVLERANAGESFASLILIDLDGFKKINDLHGHQAGDALLCEIGRRMETTMRQHDRVARLGGDEFALLAQGRGDFADHEAGVIRLANRLISAIQQPILTNDGWLAIAASLGIALCRGDVSDSSQLLHNADIALYRAKQNGRGSFQIFEQRMADELHVREALERDVAQAVAQDSIEPYFQPLVDLRTRRIDGFEALARWVHPERGQVSPELFIPIVEQLGLMTKLTNSILRKSCRAARFWPSDIRISVNFSPSELIDHHLPGRILAILAQENFPAERLEVEITETAFITDKAAAQSALATLRGFGIAICLDDFGTGYSSLSHLNEMKFDRVKIDRSFIQAMHTNADSEKIVDAILGLTRSLQLPTVGEGVEDEKLLEKLASKGCEFGQGYYFGKAVTAAAAAAMLHLPLEEAHVAQAPAKEAIAA